MKNNNTKHFTLELHEAGNNKGALRAYIGVDAENKSELRAKVKEYNEQNPEKYLALKTAFVLHT